jgi:hypothetical protein
MKEQGWAPLRILTYSVTVTLTLPCLHAPAAGSHSALQHSLRSLRPVLTRPSLHGLAEFGP